MIPLYGCDISFGMQPVSYTSQHIVGARTSTPTASSTVPQEHISARSPEPFQQQYPDVPAQGPGGILTPLCSSGQHIRTKNYSGGAQDFPVYRKAVPSAEKSEEFIIAWKQQLWQNSA